MRRIELRMPSEVIVDGGSSAELATLLARHGLERPLVITDSFLLEHGPVGDILAGLEGAAVFSGIQPDPTVETVHEALDALLAHDADGVVAIGGGSSIDTAKAAALAATNSGPLVDYAGYDKFEVPGLPVVAVPTTAGTGSEVTRVTVITDTERDVKMMMRDDKLLPRAAVVDYRLTLGCPPALTAHVGVDSLTHAIEAYVSSQANAVTDLYALEAARLIALNLRRAFTDGSDAEAREALMLGAMLAGVAFSNASVCLVHGMSRPIGAHFHLAHGLSNALLLPTVTRFSVTGAPARYAAVARAIGVAGDGDADRDACDRLVEELERLNADLGVPRIRDLNIDKADFLSRLPAMADAALASGSPGFNPRPASHDEIVELYQHVY